MTVRVLVADDNPVVRMGLRSLIDLDEHLEVVAEASSGPEAVERARESGPDVVLLDVRMPGGGGLDVLPQLCESSRVLMLTYSDEPAVVSEALRGGATGYLVHGAFDSAELATAIRDTAAGQTRLSPPAATVLLAGLSGAADTDEGAVGATVRGVDPDVVKRARLSRREAEIAGLIVRGLTNSEVAAELFIEEKTVKNHVNHIFAKLQVTSRPAAIAALLAVAQ